MFRTAAKRLLYGATSGNISTARIGSLPNLQKIISSYPFSTSSPDPHSLPNQPPNVEIPNVSNSASASASSSSSSSTAEEARRYKRQRPGVDYQDEQARVLEASLRHVVRLGWTEASMIAGAREVGVSPAIVGSFPRKEAALVEFFMDDCLQRLIDRIDSGEDLQNLIPSERISKLIKIRLEMQAPYISKWPQALSIQAQPLNVPTSFKQRAMLVDEIWHAAGDEASDIDWYVKRTVLGGIYSTTEIYMLTDSSPDFRDTWTFLDGRVKDAFDLKKTIQEAKYLAEAVGAGMGGSLQGFVNKIFQR
ncbi:ubiquinone biosynthesis protein COQ9, mitochondrial [Pistacia vera]|uniref:ubiquinone biosynthesis protein COQ9, mitochondrial n=1 Tax=Pistacia vera TaxID=55513 RepID=UPI00126330B6|nr:ubiquinone biosynthesis protein COQ9, mitochondrial [Pistacia vera]